MSIMACSRVVVPVLVLTFAIFIFTRPDFNFFRSIRSHKISSELPVPGTIDF